MTSDGTPTGPLAKVLPESDHNLRYTLEELKKLSPPKMSLTVSSQPCDPAPSEAVAQSQTSGNSTVPDIKTGVEQHQELAGEPTAIVADNGEDDQGLDQTARKRPSIAEGMDNENGMAVGPAESHAAGPSGGASTVAGAKKKKKKSSGKKKKPNPTGFEEFYADPPITPEDHKEEVEQLYHL